MEAERYTGITFYIASDQGTREYQQDKGYAQIQNGFGMAILCDGMGGMNGGERASHLAVQQFVQDVNHSWPLKNISDFMENEIRYLDRLVYYLRDDSGERLNAGSTAVAAIIEDNRLYWVSVGDSRMYLLREGRLRCLTAQHNYKTMLQDKLSAGAINLEYYNAEIHQGEALTSYLGMGQLPLVDTNHVPLELYQEDMLLLCSDGLYKTLSDEQIQALLEECGGHLFLAAERLIETARRLGGRGQDNTTLILMKLEQTEKH